MVVNLLRKPKYVNHVIKPIIVRLDSAAFLFKDPSNMVEPVYIISDRYSHVVKGENPQALISIILEGDRPHQLRMAIRGDFHLEKPSYYVKDPRDWVEWGWLIFSQPEIARLRQYLTLFIDSNTDLWELM